MTAPEASNLALTVGGLALACLGIALQWGPGAGLTVAGSVCFVAGALSAARPPIGRRRIPRR